MKSSDDCKKLAGRCRRDVTWRGSSFQTRAAATGKVRPPTADNRVRQRSRMMMTLSIF